MKKKTAHKPKQTKRVQDPLIFYKKRFDAEYPTDADCFDALSSIGMPERTFKCKRDCPNGQWVRVSDRIIQCSNCKESISITTGTFFENVKKVREWLFAIWLHEHRIEVNAHRFVKVTGISSSTGWKIFRKIAMIITELLSQIEGSDLVASGMFINIISRRSLVTPAWGSPITEEDETLTEFAGQDSLGIADQLNSTPETEETVQVQTTETERFVLNHLTEEPVFVDSLRERTYMEFGELLPTLLTLQFNGLAARLPGERYALVAAPAELPRRHVTSGRTHQQIIEKVTDAQEFIRERFQGVSRKYLQHYICVFSYFANAIQWPKGILLEACRAADVITDSEIRNYVSPPQITLI